MRKLILLFLLLSGIAFAQYSPANYCADAGASDTYACNLSPSPVAYVTGTTYFFKANTSNTGAATINFNGFGAKSIVKVSGGITTALSDNDILAGQIVELTYDGTNMQIQSTLGTTAYNTVQNNGTPLTQRTTLNCTGNATCSDSGGVTVINVSGGGGATGNSITSTTPVTVSANTTSDQKLMELALTAGFLNSANQPFQFNGAGVYTTTVAQTPTLTFKIKLCTVSGCGSGTVVTLINIVSTATIASVTNNNWNFSVMGYTATTGATGNLEIHGPLSVDLGALTTTADSIFNDTNVAVSGNIDLTAALFVDFTVATSTGSAGNSVTQRQGGVMPFAAVAAPVTSVNGSTGAVSLSLGTVYCADATGSTTTYTCTPSPTVASYTTGMLVSFVPQAANTAGSTVNISGLGAKSIIAANTTGSTLVADDLLAAGVYTLEYDGTNFRKINGPSSAWTGYSYQNSWSDQGGGIQAGQYSKDNSGRVWLRGAMKPGTTTTNTVVVALPAGYRPVATRVLHYQSISTGGGTEPGQMSIYATGNIQFEGVLTGTVNLMDFEGLSFSVY